LKIRIEQQVGVILLLVVNIATGQTNPGTGVAGTVHDARVYFVSDQVCIQCHAPHNTGTERPLWNHAMSTANYTLYGSSTMNAASGQPGPMSKLCLSCHDGTVGISDYGGSPVGPGGIRFGRGDKAYIATDLRNDHPVGIAYDTALATSDRGLADPATKSVTIGTVKSRTGTIASMMLYDGKVECPSCHDVHNIYTAGNKGLVKVGLTGSSLCLQCHTK